MKYLEDSRLTQLTSDLTGALLNTRSSNGSGSSSVRVGDGGGGGIGVPSTRAPNSNDENKQTPPPPVPSSLGSRYTYNPAVYSSYKNSHSSSCRVIHGRVEA
eukprot:CAMPEP_0183766846 /NCGR_PEP_ID=MMETSP0739-20130205/11822_1 /TAXON_ID=385413 /ORGANISM="Thalassiosira miniscula, Strain CCMP1093" /LENGTH=101 /DNA_ID=CAMNT_0026005687 /DNA_START=9 /DNA_END=311 /DNA_ORIENTATION=+